jgi:hypothetical protein
MLKELFWGPDRETHVLLRRPRFLGHPSTTFIKAYISAFNARQITVYFMEEDFAAFFSSRDVHAGQRVALTSISLKQ